MQKGIIIRMYPSNEQISLLNQMFGCVRNVYNHFLDYASNNKDYSYDNWSKLLTEMKNKEEYNYLNDCDKFVLQNSLRNLKMSFSNYFNKRSKHPVFKSKRKQEDAYRTNYTNNNIEINKEYLKLPKLGLVKVRYNKDLSKARIINVTVKRHGSIYEASIIYEEEIIKYPCTNKKIGIDLGVRKLITTSEGEKFVSSLDLIKIENKIKKEQRKLSKKSKDSNNYKKQKSEINKLYRYKSNYIKDVIHKATTKLVKENDCIYMEDIEINKLLDIQDMKIKRKKMLSMCLGKIKTYLEYKCKMHERELITIDKYYPSSKICSNCSNIYEVKDKEIYKCPVCGSVVDRDTNAAINVLKRGLSLSF